VSVLYCAIFEPIQLDDAVQWRRLLPLAAIAEKHVWNYAQTTRVRRNSGGCGSSARRREIVVVSFETWIRILWYVRRRADWQRQTDGSVLLSQQCMTLCSLLPVLWMTSCLPIIDQAKATPRAPARRILRDSPTAKSNVYHWIVFVWKHILSPFTILLITEF